MSPLNDAKQGEPRYWRSYDELSGTAAISQFAEGEFASYDPAEIQQGQSGSPSRRSFMKLMAASAALAGVGVGAGCRRWPKRTLAPYKSRPEDHIPGVPERYATVMELGGIARPLLVTSFDGRPTKIEGNPDHPQSRGAAGLFDQASVLDLYDPSRSRSVESASGKTWGQFTQFVERLRQGGGDRLAVLCEASDSPSVLDMKDRLLKAMPKAKWFTYEAINRDNELAGAKAAFGTAVRRHLHLDKAAVIACFDADLLGVDPCQLVHARGFAAGRALADSGAMSRLYVAESAYSITGSNADIRAAVKSSDIGLLLTALAGGLGVPGQSAVEVPAHVKRFVSLLVSDLQANRGKSIVVAGAGQPAAAHELAYRINAHLGNLGQTITFTAEPRGDEPGSVESIKTLVDLMNGSAISTLLILGGNPVYDAPADLGFAAALAKVEHRIHLSHYIDETSKQCTWHLPRAHYLEAWGDGRSYDGTVSIQQPLIRPLFDGKSIIEALALVIGDELAAGYDIVRRTFKSILPEQGFEVIWRHSLHDGLVKGSGAKPVDVAVQGDAKTITIGGGNDTMEVAFLADPCMYDGRFANNGWLQELPDPLTKLVWDNAALMSRTMAAKLGVKHGDLVSIKVGAHTMPAAAVFVMPGQADDSVGLALGYGRSHTAPGEAIGNANGFNAYQIRTTTGMGFASAEVKAAGGTYKLVTTQEHHYIDATGMKGREGRVGELVREASLEDYKAHRDFAKFTHLSKEHTKTGKPLQLFQDPLHYDRGPQWGMAIDLNACIGCNACVVACQAENNIPIVGKEQVSIGREMHWIRIDRYFSGDQSDTTGLNAIHQPVTCQHCENAPCEQVCPVAATTHDTEGLNVMIYNRCIGTRYCSNNCPYKVRRFNFFDFNAKGPKAPDYTATTLNFPDTQQAKVDPIRRLQFNPDVTVRMRGVMEKCTFCTQRIKAGTIPARNEGRTLTDGEITPACAQTCPTQAIVFGDLSDPNSRVSKLHHHPRAYEMLDFLNVRARNRYLARINNPGAAGGGTTAPVGHGHDHGGHDAHPAEHPAPGHG